MSDEEIKTNNSPSDAREILSDFKKDVIIEFVCQEHPDSVCVEKLSHAQFKTIHEDVEENVKELKKTLKDVAHIRGVEVDEKTDRMLGSIVRAFEQTDEQIGKQLDMFAGNGGGGSDDQTYDMGGGPETADDVADEQESEVIDVGGQIDADEPKQLPDGDGEAPAQAS